MIKLTKDWGLVITERHSLHFHLHKDEVWYYTLENKCSTCGATVPKELQVLEKLRKI